MVDSPELAVVLINYNNEDDTIPCLQSLKHQNLEDFLTIVVDNASEANSYRTLVEQFDFPVFLRNEENRGFTGGNNTGIEYALEEGVKWVLLLNNDTEVDSTFLEDILTEAEDLPPDAGVIGPTVHTYETREVWSAGGIIHPWTGRTSHRTGNNNGYRKGLVDYVVGAAMLVRADVFEEIGLLDDDFFIYYEETEFCQRARRKGWCIWYVPISGVYHKEQTQYTYSSFREYYFTRNRWIFVKKTQPIQVQAFFYPYFLIRWLILQVMFLLVVKENIPAAKATVRGAIDAILGRLGKREVD